MKPSLLVEGRSDLPFLGFEVENMTRRCRPCSVFPCDPLIFLTGANDKDLPPVRCNGEVFRPTTSIIQCVPWKENGARLSNMTHFCFPFEICWPKAPIRARFGTYFAFYCLQSYGWIFRGSLWLAKGTSTNYVCTYFPDFSSLHAPALPSKSLRLKPSSPPRLIDWVNHL